jgi:hypothetical protein
MSTIAIRNPATPPNGVVPMQVTRTKIMLIQYMQIADLEIPAAVAPEVAMQEYIEVLNNCGVIASRQGDYLELRKRVFTNAIMYGRTIYPNTRTFVLRVDSFMADLTNLACTVSDLQVQISMLAARCEEHRKEGNSLEDQHGFMVKRLSEAERIIEAKRQMLGDKAHQLEALNNSSMNRIRRILLSETTEQRKRKDELKELEESATNINGLEDCCEKMRVVVDELCLLLCEVAKAIERVSGHLKNAKRVEGNDMHVKQYREWLIQAAKDVRPQLDGFLKRHVNYVGAVSGIDNEENKSPEQVAEWNACFGQHKKRYELVANPTV